MVGLVLNGPLFGIYQKIKAIKGQLERKLFILYIDRLTLRQLTHIKEIKREKIVLIVYIDSFY